MSLIAELKRRNVIRMAGLNLTVAWLTVPFAKRQAVAHTRRSISCRQLPNAAFYCRFPAIA
ncbi:MAG: hypothetical protein ABIO30_00410 [Thermomonas sp.]